MSTGEAGVTLVLGGGFARGLAHIGVVCRLAAAGIPIRRLVGISAGAVVAASYARFGPAGLLQQAGLFMRSATGIVTRAPVNRRSLLCPHRLAVYLHGIFGAAQIEDLPGRVSIVATDLEAAEPVLLDRGPLVPALLASTSVPVFYPPLRWQGRWLCDGGLAARHLLSGPLAGEPGPLVYVVLRRRSEIQLVRRLNRLARRVLADRPFQGPWTPAWWRVWRRSAELLAQPAQAPREVPPSRTGGDVFILRPQVEHIPWNGFDQGRRAVLAGRRAVDEVLPALTRALDQAVRNGTSRMRT